MSDTLLPMRQPRLHRSELAVPGSSMEMIHKAAASAADVVFLDCADALAPPEKEAARRKIITALNEIDWRARGKTVSVRINGLDTPYMHRDVIEIMEQAGDRFDSLLVPNVTVPADLDAVEALVSRTEQAMGLSTGLGLEAVIETAFGASNVDAIAASGGRLEALHFGLAADGAGARWVSTDGLEPDHHHGHRQLALSRMVIACRAYGLRAVDATVADVADPEGYRAGARRAAALGVDGKWAIHPHQVVLANEAFSPPPAEVDRAHRVIAVMRKAEAHGQGAASLDGRMIAAAGARSAANTIALDNAVRAQRDHEAAA